MASRDEQPNQIPSSLEKDSFFTSNHSGDPNPQEQQKVRKVSEDNHSLASDQCEIKPKSVQLFQKSLPSDQKIKQLSKAQVVPNNQEGEAAQKVETQMVPNNQEGEAAQKVEAQMVPNNQEGEGEGEAQKELSSSQKMQTKPNFQRSLSEEQSKQEMQDQESTILPTIPNQSLIAKAQPNTVIIHRPNYEIPTEYIGNSMPNNLNERYQEAPSQITSQFPEPLQDFYELQKNLREADIEQENHPQITKFIGSFIRVNFYNPYYEI